jgi:hypothetical protein
MGTRFTYVEKVMDERHQLYKERAESQKTAVDDALVAVKEQTAQSFTSSEKAIFKAEDSQKAYNAGHNDLSRKMETQYSSMVPYAEAKLKWESVDKAIESLRRDFSDSKSFHQADINGLRVELMREIQSLRESRSKGTGAQEATERDRARSMAIIGLAITTILAVAGLLFKVLQH